MTSLWRNVSVNVVANSIWSCLLISAAKVHWRVQPTAARRSGMQLQIQRDAWGSARIARVSQQCLYENVQKYLKRNNGHLVTLQIWMEWKYHVCAWATHEAIFWNLHPKPKTVSELYSRTENILDNFPQVQIIKLCRALQIVWQEYICEQWRKIFYMSIRLYTQKKCSLLRRSRCLE